MVKKLQKLSADKKNGNAQLSSTVKDSAQQIWLAGLGAFSKAQEEGGKVFESLVKEGLSIQRKTQAVAEEKISEATSRVTTMASDIGSKAQGQWDKLENIFEDRVAKALSKLGVPSARDLEALTARVDALTKGTGKAAPAKAPAKAAVKAAAPAKKAAAKKAAAPRKAAAKPAAKAAPAKKAAAPAKKASAKTAAPASAAAASN
ncbi:poly(hydroxyalkanoate) granule-associated protein [Acidovorax sp. CF316]|uniref:phasin family protein n=1 Tax=Acidovorax sp. CF316 TaxID=1144317 RepID=UPI00026BD6EE|nr:phasin family protein [Acidovorax sp. CF316]EJE53647.1 poly(hydroxyalkanoate) granule-associated protein [Acidovorax sp. CF316]